MSDDQISEEGDESPPPLAGKLIRGTMWTVGMRWGMRGMGLISTVVLARLLVPEDFGLVAMAMAAIALLQVLTNFGVNVALIRDKHASADHFNTAWTINIAQHFFVAITLLVTAGWISDFYGDERLIGILWVIALNAAVSGFENIGVVQFRRQLRFAEDFRYNMIVKGSGVVITIILAVTFQNYWALVLGALSAKLIRVPVSYLVISFRPRFSLKAWNEIWGVSRWILVRGLAHFVYARADIVFLGRVGLPATVGQYSVGRELAELPTLELVNPITRSMMPGLAQIADDRNRLASAFLRALGGVAILSLPTGFGIMLVADEMVPLLLGDNWLPTVPLMKLLAVAASIFALTRIMGQLFIVLKKLKLWALLSWIQALIIVAGIYPAYAYFGVIGVPMLHIAVSVLSVFLSFLLLANMGLFGLLSLLAVIIRPIIAVAGMVAAVSAVNYVLAGYAGGWEQELFFVLAKTVTGVISYTVSIFVLWRLAGRPDGLEAELMARLPLWSRN